MSVIDSPIPAADSSPDGGPWEELLLRPGSREPASSIRPPAAGRPAWQWHWHWKHGPDPDVRRPDQATLAARCRRQPARSLHPPVPVGDRARPPWHTSSTATRSRNATRHPPCSNITSCTLPPRDGPIEEVLSWLQPPRSRRRPAPCHRFFSPATERIGCSPSVPRWTPTASTGWRSPTRRPAGCAG